MEDLVSVVKILVTGNMGYIGPSVVKQLRQTYPHAVLVGLDMGYFAHCLSNAQAFPETRVDVQYFADLRQLPKGVLDGVDAVAHLAAISNDPIGNAYEDVTLEVNYRGSMELARQAKAAGVRSFAYASSCSTYGSAGEKPRTEQSPVNPLTAYAKSKILTERDLKQLADKDFKVTCLRFGTACGMSERLRLDLVVTHSACGPCWSRHGVLRPLPEQRPGLSRDPRRCAVFRRSQAVAQGCT